jgi:hypothetical protein
MCVFTYLHAYHRERDLRYPPNLFLWQFYTPMPPTIRRCCKNCYPGLFTPSRYRFGVAAVGFFIMSDLMLYGLCCFSPSTQ